MLLREAPVHNPTPKLHFQQSGTRISNHRAMVTSDAFNSGANFALLEYQRVLTGQIRDGNTAMAAGLKMQGALEFLDTLRQLADAPTRLPTAPSQTLNPNV